MELKLITDAKDFLLGYSDATRLNNVKDKVLRLPKIVEVHDWCSEKIDSYRNDIIERYQDANNIDESQDPSLPDVYSWLNDEINQYSIGAKVRFPIIVYGNGCAPVMFERMSEAINVLSFVCSDFNHWFEEKIDNNDPTINTKLLSNNTEKQYRDFINHLYGDNENYWNYDVPALIKKRYTNWDVDQDYECGFVEKFPIPSYLRSPETFALLYDQSKNLMMTKAFDIAAKSVLQAACVIIERYGYNTGFEKTDCYDRLIKLVGIYIDFFTSYYYIYNDTAEFITRMACLILDGKEPMTTDTKFLGFDNICDFGEYPDCAAECEKMENLDAIAALKSNESYGAFRAREAIDSGYNFGKSQLQSNTFQSNTFSTNKTEDKYKAKFSKLNNIWNEVFHVKPGKLKAKINAAYFKKWYGRIPSMYSHYGAEAQITENRMRGDPTEILANTCPKFMSAMVTRTNKVFQELIDLSRRVAAANDINAKINVAKGYCTNYKIEDPRDPKGVENSIINEATLRIAKCIFQGNEVYGYTPEGIVENGKFPTANHIVISLFEENAQEEPQAMSVNEIFRSPNSITVFAHPQKIASFDELFKRSANAITQNFNERIFSSVHENMEINFKNYSNSLRRKSGELDGGDADEATLNKKIAKSIQNGIVKGLDYAIDQKARCLQVVGACYDMLGRVERLAKLAVAALHKVEVEHGDTRMNTGINNKLRNVTNTRLNQINKTNSGGRYKENLITYK